MNEVRTGVGWDIHALVPRPELILGGFHIPSDVGLDGHSDGDVLLHAITDALLGAIALDDIGKHFPSSEVALAGSDSSRFLRFAVEEVRKKHYHVANVDTTVILQEPHLGPHRIGIRESIATILDIDLDRVSVKFKTADKIGPIGEKKAAEAHAVVTIVKVG